MSLRATDGDEKAVQDDVEATPALTSTAAVLTSTSHHLPNLPAKDQLMYTACYCEENIYKLCELIKNKCVIIIAKNDQVLKPIVLLFYFHYEY